MSLNLKLWLRLSLINLFIVVLLGLLMRYKIGFEFPYFNQKNLQHAHSHFAFTGWVSHTLMVFMVHYLTKRTTALKTINYNLLLTLNMIAAYGMLIFFFIYGYRPVSIFFSTLSILVSYAFAYRFFKDLKLAGTGPAVPWFKASLLFNVLSSLGTFVLARMMVFKNFEQNWYLASVYYYLHFQYNGWFFFACMGLLVTSLAVYGINEKEIKRSFYFFFFACFPAFLLSVLWLKLPIWLYALTVAAAGLQLYVWGRFILANWQPIKSYFLILPKWLAYVAGFAGFALTVKFLLQAGSTVPLLSKLAFGFRPVVIAYLHLVLLAVISTFLLFYMYAEAFFKITSSAKKALLFFMVAVLFNELALAAQGVASFSYTVVPFINEILFMVAIALAVGSLLLLLANKKTS